MPDCVKTLRRDTMCVNVAPITAVLREARPCCRCGSVRVQALKGGCSFGERVEKRL